MFARPAAAEPAAGRAKPVIRCQTPYYPFRYPLGSTPAMPDTAPTPSEPRRVRLNKLLADAGIASRRKSDELIAAGKVSVDGEPVMALGI